MCGNDSYTGFAYVYDRFMDNVPYRAWAKQTYELLKKEGIYTGIVADLGCGTGVFTMLMSDYGYDMIGIDSSEDMLGVAMEKNAHHNILYLCQDMREFELYGTCAAIVSRCDSINYLQDADDLYKVFRWVNNYLDPGAPFLFDCNSLYKYRELLADRTFAENREFGSFIWENFFDEETSTNCYDLTLYIQDTENPDRNDRYQRWEETHYQRAFTIDEIKDTAKKAGLKFGYVLDADTNGEVTKNTERWLFCFYEQGKSADFSTSSKQVRN